MNDCGGKEHWAVVSASGQVFWHVLDRDPRIVVGVERMPKRAALKAIERQLLEETLHRIAHVINNPPKRAPWWRRLSMTVKRKVLSVGRKS